MALKSTQDVLRGFVLRRLPSARRHAFANDDDLLDLGILDSLSILVLVEFVQSKFEIHVSNHDLFPENFESINRLAAFIERKRHSYSMRK